MEALDVVGRQPIFDRGRHVFAHELLFRTLSGPTAAETAGTLRDQMAADVIFNAVTIGIAELEDIVRRDPALSLQLLQLASIGATGGMCRTVRTLRNALVLVGWRRLQSWASLLLIGGKGHASEEDLTTALMRARMCELAASFLDRSLTEAAFTAGRFSAFDVLLHVPLEDTLRDLPLEDDLRRAILETDGVLGELVADVTDFQLGRADQAIRTGVADSVLSHTSLEALIWPVEMTSTVSD